MLEEICAICLSPMKASDQPATLSCGHRFCAGCIVPWLRLKSECPCCRDDSQRSPHPTRQLPCDSRCPVCIRPLGQAGEPIALECGHRFDAACIVPLLRNHPACPVCLDVLHDARQEDVPRLLFQVSTRTTEMGTAAPVATASRRLSASPHRGMLGSLAFRQVVSPRSGRAYVQVARVPSVFFTREHFPDSVFFRTRRSALEAAFRELQLVLEDAGEDNGGGMFTN